MTQLFLVIFVCYGIGSIPFGLIFTKLFLEKDIRLEGSGNIGATNVLRTSGKSLGALTLLFDVGKSYLAAFMAQDLGFLFLGCFVAFLGHLFPVWLKFKGGKGVATYLGILLYLDWHAACFALMIWIGVFIWTRLSSLSALITVFMTPIWFLICGAENAAILTGLMSCLVIVRHHENIKRLCRGEEKKF